MTIIEEVLLEEYQRTLRIKNALLAEIEQLPKGSLQKKKIKGKEYCEGDSVKSQYVREPMVGIFQEQINKRRDNLSALKELEKTLLQIERALGKEFIDEHTAKGIR